MMCQHGKWSRTTDRTHVSTAVHGLLTSAAAQRWSESKRAHVVLVQDATFAMQALQLHIIECERMSWPTSCAGFNRLDRSTQGPRSNHPLMKDPGAPQSLT